MVLNEKIDKDVKELLRVTSIVSLVMLLVLGKLYSHTSTFPVCPFYDFIPVMPRSLFMMLYIVLVICVVFSIFISNKIITAIIISTLFMFGLFDVNNIHPFLLCYWSIFIVILLHQLNKIDSPLTLNLARWLLIGIYLASSIQKINPYFVEGIQDWLIAPFALILSKENFELLKYADAFIPTYEMVITIFLLFKKTRKIGTIMAIAMHIMIIFLLSPLIRPNFISVHPFNLSIIVFDIVLFLNYKGNIFKETFESKKKIIVAVVLVFSLGLPTAHVFGYGHDYLSYDLYSGRYKYSYFIFNKKYKNNLPQNIVKHTFYTGHKDYYMFYLDGWLYYETYGSIYRENFVLDYYKNYMKRYSGNGTRCIFVIQRKGKHEYYPI